jgi:ATP-binding cassette subfamily C protein
MKEILEGQLESSELAWGALEMDEIQMASRTEALSSLRGICRLLWRSAAKQTLAAVVLSILLSLTEGVSLAMIVPLLALFGDAGRTVAPGPKTQLLFHGLAATRLPRAWWPAALLVSLVILVGLLAQLNGVLTTLRLGVLLKVRRTLGSEIFGAIVHADWAYLTRVRASDLTMHLTTGLDRVGQITNNLMQAVANGLIGALVLGLVLYLSPLLTFVCLVCFGLLIPWQRRRGREAYGAGAVITEKTVAVFESSMERLQNLKVVKAFETQDTEHALFNRRYGAMLQQLAETEWRISSSSRQFQILSLVLLCGITLLGLGPLHLSTATMLIFLFAFLRATPRLTTLQEKATALLTDLPAYRQIEALLAECTGHAEQQGDDDAPALMKDITLEGVGFAYAPGGRQVLEGVSLTLKAGQVTAVAGQSGAGKSTLADLVMGLLSPQKGAVRVDGQTITQANARAWRRRIGYVSQDTLLFNDTIRANLVWAKADATEAQLLDALDEASAEFVRDLPEGLETKVGDRGIRLSHGQRQRIALARALLLKPELLILDEATNSLDIENEGAILRSVRRGRNVTTLLISHRPSAVQVADRVYLLVDGRVKRSGTWAEMQTEVLAEAAQEG